MPPKNSGGSSKFLGGHKVFHRTAQTAFVRVVTPRLAVHGPACLTTDAVNVCQKQDGIRLAFRELLSKLLLQICRYVTGQN